MTLTEAIASARDGSVFIAPSYGNPNELWLLTRGGTPWTLLNSLPLAEQELAALRAQYPEKFQAEKE